MPQASDELRKTIDNYFHTGIDDHVPHAYLESKGWTIDSNWNFLHSGYKDLGEIPIQEWDCILFLIHEWDYGLPLVGDKK